MAQEQKIKLYKLTNADHQTKNNTTWGEDVTHSAEDCVSPMKLCTNTVIHAYDDMHMAVMMNPAHGNYRPFVMWEALADQNDYVYDGTKIGVRSLTTLRIIQPPEITTEQRVRFAILSALFVHSDEKFRVWAENWLNKKDRTSRAANAAADAAAYATARAAAYAAAYAAADAADAAAYTAAYAADAAAYAADAAAANSNAVPENFINFTQLLQQAIREEQ